MVFDDLVALITKIENKQIALKLHTILTLHVLSQMHISPNHVLGTQAAQKRPEHEQSATQHTYSSNGIHNIVCNINPASPIFKRPSALAAAAQTSSREVKHCEITKEAPSGNLLCVENANNSQRGTYGTPTSAINGNEDVLDDYVSLSDLKKV